MNAGPFSLLSYLCDPLNNDEEPLLILRDECTDLSKCKRLCLV
jgi:hypothetical protein